MPFVILILTMFSLTAVIRADRVEIMQDQDHVKKEVARVLGIAEESILSEEVLKRELSSRGEVSAVGIRNLLDDALARVGEGYGGRVAMLDDGKVSMVVYKDNDNIVTRYMLLIVLDEKKILSIKAMMGGHVK